MVRAKSQRGAHQAGACVVTAKMEPIETEQEEQRANVLIFSLFFFSLFLFLPLFSNRVKSFPAPVADQNLWVLSRSSIRSFTSTWSVGSCSCFRFLSPQW